MTDHEKTLKIYKDTQKVLEEILRWLNLNENSNKYYKDAPDIKEQIEEILPAFAGLRLLHVMENMAADDRDLFADAKDRA